MPDRIGFGRRFICALSLGLLGMTVASPSLRAAHNGADPEERPSKETK
jgi:hypothetical protein